MKNSLITFCLFLLIMSCKSIENKPFTIWISGFKANYEHGTRISECYLISNNNSLSDENWELFNSEIDGFNFEKGILKKVEIIKQKTEVVEKVTDKSTIKYRILKEIENKSDNRLMLVKEWILERIMGDFLNDSLVIPTLQINLFDMTLSGNAGCNRYSGTLSELGLEKISISNMASSLKMCPEETYEDQYLKLLNKVVSYKVEQSKLSLFDKANNTVMVLKENAKISNEVRINDIWVAARLGGYPINRMVKVPSLEVNSSEMKIYGNDGCNEYFANIENLDNNTITLGIFGNTRKLCDNMEFPDRYHQALKKIHSYKFDNRFLIFLDKAGIEVLAFLKTD